MNLIDVLSTLELKTLDENSFQGHNLDIPTNQIYGGQLLASSIIAAAKTTSEYRLPSSIHANFIRAGKINQNVIYDVERLRDGVKMSHRHINAKQSGKTIFESTIRFSEIENSEFDYQSVEIPNVNNFDTIEPLNEIFKKVKIQNTWTKYFANNEVCDIRQISPNLFLNKQKKNLEAKEIVWFKFNTETMAGDNKIGELNYSNHKNHKTQTIYRALLCFFTDQFAYSGALRKAGLSWQTPNSFFVSLDHAQHFYSFVDLRNWHLLIADSPIGSESRGLGQGYICDQFGRIVSVFNQEGYFKINE